MRQPIHRVARTVQSVLNAKTFGVRRIWWGIGVFGVLAIGLIVTSVYTNQTIIDRSTAAEVNFTVYAPSRAPKGYVVERDQIRASNEVLTYGFRDEKTNKNITVTVQDRSSKFDIAQMSKGGSISSTATANGTLYDLSVGQSSQYLLDTGDALIYLTSPERIDNPTISALASSLKKIN